MIKDEFNKMAGGNRSARVRNLTLENFRNYFHLELELGSRFNLIAGANGQGKTNLLESLHMVSTTRLLRGQREIEAIKDGTESSSVSVELEPLQTQITLQLERGARKRVLLNGMKLPRASDVLGRLACVCISSEDLEIVRGEPASRRMFFDLELSSRSPAYLRHFSIYKRALEQRNALIKQARETFVAAELWEVWEEQLSEHGAAIRAHRREFVGLLERVLPPFHSRIGGGEQASLLVVERDEAPDRVAMSRELAAARLQDIARGSTSIGPHRDDVDFKVSGRSARLFASQGQQRTLIISIKLATLILGRELNGSTPLLLLDDIFSDLDADRRWALVDIVLEVAEQTVLTCTEPAAAGQKIVDQADVFVVSGGEIVKGS
jgi:DNA replication and repair protein RecF